MLLFFQGLQTHTTHITIIYDDAESVPSFGALSQGYIMQSIIQQEQPSQSANHEEEKTSIAHSFERSNHESSDNISSYSEESENYNYDD